MPTTTVAAAAHCPSLLADLPCHALTRQSRACSPGMAAPTQLGRPSARALAAAELPRDAAAAAPSTSTSLQQEKAATSERKMVKLLRKLQNDKQRLNEQVQLLLDSQAKLLQTVQSVPSMQLGQPTHVVQQQQQREPLVYEAPAAPRFQQSRCSEPCLMLEQQHMQLQAALSEPHSTSIRSSTAEQQAAANTRPEQQQQAPLPEGCCACRSPPVHHASPASAPPAVAAAMQAAVGSSSGRSPPPPVQQQGVRGAVLLPLPAAAEQQGAQWQQHQLQQQVQEQHVALQDQATAIHGLKGVIAELELQTSLLRARAAKADSDTGQLSEARAALAAQEQQLSEATHEVGKLRELAQAAVGEALRTIKEAEEQRAAQQQQLEQQQAAADAADAAATKAMQAAAGQQAAFDSQLAKLAGDKGQLAAQLDQMQAERRQLLQLLRHATDQIMELQDELGPALLKGSSSPGRASRLSAANAAAAAAASEAATGRLSSPDANPSDVGQQLSGAIVALAGATGQLLAQTRQVAAAADAAKQDQAAAASELQELGEALLPFKELQRQHGKLQAEHLLLQQEHSDLLARQVDATSQRNSLRQQWLVLEDAHAAAKQQVAELQAEMQQLRDTAAAAAERANDSSPAADHALALRLGVEQEQGLLAKQQLLTLAADNARLAVAASAAAAGQLAAERELLLSRLVEPQAVAEMDARNRALLQEVTRLLDQVAGLHSQLAVAQAAAAAANARTREPSFGGHDEAGQAAAAGAGDLEQGTSVMQPRLNIGGSSCSSTAVWLAGQTEGREADASAAPGAAVQQARDGHSSTWTGAEGGQANEVLLSPRQQRQQHAQQQPGSPFGLLAVQLRQQQQQPAPPAGAGGDQQKAALIAAVLNRARSLKQERSSSGSSSLAAAGPVRRGGVSSVPSAEPSGSGLAGSFSGLSSAGGDRAALVAAVLQRHKQQQQQQGGALLASASATNVGGAVGSGSLAPAPARPHSAAGRLLGAGSVVSSRGSLVAAVLAQHHLAPPAPVVVGRETERCATRRWPAGTGAAGGEALQGRGSLGCWL